MKHLIIVITLALFIFNSSCTEKPKQAEILVTFEQQSQDFMTWWVYFNDSLDLSSDFVPLDTLGNPILKGEFLEHLTSGKFLPVNVQGQLKYQLYMPQKELQEDVLSAIKLQSQNYLNHFRMEGKSLPDFTCETLEGKEYNLSDPEGKYLIIKCWFLACKSCIKEFPELNEMVQHYKSRDDLIFLSLAYDDEQKLKKFLSSRKFAYETASVSLDFLRSELAVTMYPTHIVVGKDGKVLKVVNGADQLKAFLRKELET